MVRESDSLTAWEQLAAFGQVLHDIYFSLNQDGIMKSGSLKYHHLAIPTRIHREGEEYLAEYKIYHSGYETSEYGIEWMYYEDDCELPEIVKTMPHIAFEVDDLDEAIAGKKVIIEPNSPSPGNRVAFIEADGIPIEFIQVSEGRSE